ncbi:PorT family protein [Dysgonomonas sp. 216]|uniref:outer membrane beta-barrel protein n=1 Tax=Dysgonomonas sp. 216 TaxID=2302934 RepID=UPI0013D66FC8|nr:outer membrane beta-barrel protein [Dysgonomonas sp. 216]NDW19724.1 PorT family protein [Dysgonomonas sp. 216]
MKFKPKALLVICALFITSNISARLPISIKAKAGANISHIDMEAQYIENWKSNNGSGHSIDSRVGYQLGVDVQMDIPSSNFFVQSGVTLSNKGFDWNLKSNGALYYFFTQNNAEYVNISRKRTDAKMKIKATYIQIPIMVGYNMKLSKFNINLAGGTYFSYGVLGKTKSKGNRTIFNIGRPPYQTNINKEFDTFDDILKNFDMGLNGVISVDYSRFSLSYGYELGLSNIAKMNRVDVFNVESLKNRTMYITLGYKVF